MAASRSARIGPAPFSSCLKYQYTSDPSARADPIRRDHAARSSSEYSVLLNRRYENGEAGILKSFGTGESSVSATHHAAPCEARTGRASDQEGWRNSKAQRKVGGR